MCSAKTHENRCVQRNTQKTKQRKIHVVGEQRQTTKGKIHAFGKNLIKKQQEFICFCDMGPPRGSKSSKIDSFLYYFLKSKKISKFTKL